jgi:thermitase
MHPNDRAIIITGQKWRLPGWFVLILIAAFALASAGLGTARAQEPPQPAAFQSGVILVKFKRDTPTETMTGIHRQLGGQEHKAIEGIEVQVVSVPAGREKEMAAAYAHHPNVLFAELDGVVQASFTPNDPRVGEQWQYNNTGQSGGTADADIDAFEAWDVTTGSSSVAIAVLDSGIDQNHPDLAGKITKNANFTTSPTVDDLFGHGTHVAGSVAASTNNSTGVAGTCPNCTLYNVKVLDDTNSGFNSWVANGITWAADNGAKVINMSLGGTTASSTLETAVNYAWSRGVVLVAAAMNNNSSAAFYPAFYTNVIAVAATDHNDAKASFSNFGAWVDVAAPGDEILSTAPNHTSVLWPTAVTYGTLDGTSMATPHVAGLAGLIWSASPSSDNICVRSRIETKADQITGTGTNWVHGRINASTSVKTPCITISDAAVLEQRRGASLTVELSHAAISQVTVAYATANGTATTPSDYTSKSGTLTFNVGERRKTIALGIRNDLVQEPDQSFYVNLSNPTGAIITKGQGEVDILNDDPNDSNP